MATIVGIDNEQPARGEHRYVVFMGEDGEEVDVNAASREAAVQAAEEWAVDNLHHSCQKATDVTGPMVGYY